MKGRSVENIALALICGMLAGVVAQHQQASVTAHANALVYVKPLSGWHPTCCVAALIALDLGDVQYAEGCSR